MVDTVSTSSDGLAEVVKAAVAQAGKEQTAPYTQGDVDLSSKEAVILADRKRFDFVNKIKQKGDYNLLYSPIYLKVNYFFVSFFRTVF